MYKTNKIYPSCKLLSLIASFVETLELPTDPKKKAARLSDYKQKWFYSELEGFLMTSFCSQKECDNFIKRNYIDSSQSSFFDFE